MKKNNYLKFFLLSFTFFFFINCQKRIVIVPIADITNKIIEQKQNLKHPIFSKNNPEQLSQALYGELLEELTEVKENNDWIKVKCLEQNVYSNNQEKSQPLEGYIKKNQTMPVQSFHKYNIVIKKQYANIYESVDPKSNVLRSLSIGTKLYTESIINDEWLLVILNNDKEGFIKLDDINILDDHIENIADIRSNVLNTALQFLDNPYRWGGRSAYDEKNKEIYTSTDCSGFTNLVYRANGIEIPKNSRSQYKKSTPILNGKDLKDGDLIFLSPIQTPNRINHVIIYYGSNLIIECTGQKPDCKTRIIKDQKRFDEKIENIQSGKKYKENYIYFGSYLNDDKKLK